MTKLQPFSGRVYPRARQLDSLRENSPEDNNESLRNKLNVSEKVFNNFLKATQALSTAGLGETDVDDLENVESLTQDQQRAVEDLFIDKEFFYQITSMLTPKEARVFELRFGILDGQYRSLEQVGEILGLSKARIGFIISNAARRIRAELATEEKRVIVETRTEKETAPETVSKSPTKTPREETEADRARHNELFHILGRMIMGDPAAKKEFMIKFQSDIDEIITTFFSEYEQYRTELKRAAMDGVYQNLDSIGYWNIGTFKSHFTKISIDYIWSWLIQNVPGVPNPYN